MLDILLKVYFMFLNSKIFILNYGFEVDNYLCWGTPNDYETFIYWQSFFHKAQWHPYNLQKDSTVNKAKTEMLKKKYTTFTQEHK